jgi:type III restriction enzyme
MSNFEVNEPILNSPFVEPQLHWFIQSGQAPEKRDGRRAAIVFPPRNQSVPWQPTAILQPSAEYIGGFELAMVQLIRDRVKAWRAAGYPGVTRTTLELLGYWQRDGREKRLFFAQVEAAEVIIFLMEARADFRQGIEIPRDEPSADRKADGFAGFVRYACKMATGSGKSTVMGMLAAWSILNKVNDRNDARFSDVVMIVAPNVTIRDRLRELNPDGGEASLYRTRDLVPPHYMTQLSQGKVLVRNWHVFEPQAVQTGGVSSRVNKAGVEVRTIETINIGTKTTTARGSRYLTQDDYDRQVAAGMVKVISEERDKTGALKKAKVESVRYVESDTALISRVLGKDVGGKQNILVMNDEAHHAYRILKDEPDPDEEEDEEEEFFKEATVWVDGLDRLQKLRGINFCLDLSATPYFLGRVGQETNKPFPWVVSDFGLIDAIESGLVKIPQLAVRDTTGADIPGYFNIWRWMMEDKLTPAERGGSRGGPKPEAILKYAHHPIAMLAGLWEKEREGWAKNPADPRPPVFILVCKNTAIAKVIYEWLADNKQPTGIPPANVAGFRNHDGKLNTIRVDSKVVNESDSDNSKSDEVRWMRFTLDTVGKTNWPSGVQGKPIFPDGFEELAAKLERPLHPPGRDVRCIVSVGMLTEGWDCNTVTHIVGLRPFMSQLLCEQVVGRGLRRASYELDEKTGKFTEEVATVFGVPFEVIPFKSTTTGPVPPPPRRNHIHAIPQKMHLEIKFPRVEGYTQAIRNRVTVDWKSVPKMVLEPGKIPPEVQARGLSVNNQGRMTLTGPGKTSDLSLKEFREKRRIQELVFELARTLTKNYVQQPKCGLPAHVLFPQLVPIVQKYLDEKVTVHKPADIKDLFLAPYYGWLVERLLQAIQPDTTQGETPEVPRYETSRGAGSTVDVDFWTSRDVREVTNSHLNFVVADTKRWEQTAAYYIDTHKAVESFAKNAGLGFAIPYLHNGQMHDYIPDFIVRIKGKQPRFLIIETKGFDDLEEIKRAAAERWVNAVNNEGSFGEWIYRVAKKPTEVQEIIDHLSKGE